METAFIHQLWRRGKMGVSYLVNNINPDGSFNYCVDAMTGTVADDYNVLRHAGTVFELCEWVNVTQDYSILDQIRIAMLYLQKRLQPWGSVSCIIENDEVKLGGSTLTLLAFCSYYRLTRDPGFEKPMTQLADFILLMQKENGDFHGRLRWSTRKFIPIQSRLFSGQALLALVNYHSICGGRAYLLAAKRYLCFEMSAARDPASTHAWLAKGLMALYDKEPSEAILLMIRSIGINAMRILYGNSDRSRNNIVPEDGTTTAKTVSIGEALVPFLEISLLFDEPEHLLLITKALQDALQFCFGNQLIEDRLVNGLNLFGGLINAKTDHRIRIDFVQHFICSATNLLRLSSYRVRAAMYDLREFRKGQQMNELPGLV